MIDQPRLAIVGAGSRASQVARALCRLNLVSELVLVDPSEPSHARIERADLFRLHAPIGPVSVRATGYDTLRGVPLVLVVLDRGEADDVDSTGVRLIDCVVDALDRHVPEAVVVVASEPSEALVERMQARSTRAEARIFGTGTLPDTLCLKDRVARHLNVDAAAVDLQVVGWHGSDATPLWSRAQIGGTPLVDAGHLDASVCERLVAACRKQWADAVVTSDEDRALCRIVHAVLKDTHAVLPVATYMRGGDIFDDASSASVVISLPCVIGAKGVERVLVPPVASAERESLNDGKERARTASILEVSRHAERPRAG